MARRGVLQFHAHSSRLGVRRAGETIQWFGCIAKPFDLDELLSAVECSLSRTTLMRYGGGAMPSGLLTRKVDEGELRASARCKLAGT